MLWVGSAAIPLHNIAWVDAFRLKPDWGAAAVRLSKWLFVAALVHVAINQANGGEARVGENGNLALVIAVIGLFAALKTCSRRRSRCWPSR